MVDIFYITTVIQASLFGLVLLFTLLYFISILSIRRFHHRNNIFILNVCFTIITTAIFFTIYFKMAYFDFQRLYTPNSCIILFYALNIASIGIPFAFVAFSVHRLCSIVYHTKVFFKKKRWTAICITSQWITEFVISLSFLIRQGPVSI
jgi:hypothetical protein